MAYRISSRKRRLNSPPHEAQRGVVLATALALEESAAQRRKSPRWIDVHTNDAHMPGTKGQVELENAHSTDFHHMPVHEAAG